MGRSRARSTRATARIADQMAVASACRPAASANEDGSTATANSSARPRGASRIANQTASTYTASPVSRAARYRTLSPPPSSPSGAVAKGAGGIRDWRVEGLVLDAPFSGAAARDGLPVAGEIERPVVQAT